MKPYIKYILIIGLVALLIPWKKKAAVLVADFQDIDPNRIENIKPGTLIYFKGVLETSSASEPFRDREFLSTAITGALQFKREVEMYQWVDRREHIPGRNDRLTSQELDWATKSARSKIKENPEFPDIDAYHHKSNFCRIGKIKLRTNAAEYLFWWTGDATEELALTPVMLTAEAKKRFILSRNKLYSSVEAAAGTPKLGDFRVSYSVERPGNMYSGFGTLNPHGYLHGWPDFKNHRTAGIFPSDFSKEQIIDLLYAKRTWFWR